jgi:putative ubiquitin-RnfH superfamily antitoxin RatB of RatAB toxin-antitoxin module
MAETISIAVVYALPERQDIVDLVVPKGTTVMQAVELSQLPARFSAIGARPLQCAVFGRIVKDSDVLADGDRVEILRPLLIDPKESRRQAAARGRGAKR